MRSKIISLTILFGLGVFGYIIYYNHIRSSQDLSAVRPFGFLRLEIPEDSLMSLDFQDNNLPFNLKPTILGTFIDIGCPNIAASASIPPTPHPKTESALTIVV